MTRIEKCTLLLIGSLLFVLLILVQIISFGGGAFDNYSSGERTGIVTKISKKGFIWKTWEGELNLGGARKTSDGLVANIYHFSVTDEDIANTILEHQRSGNRVTLCYKQWVIKPMRKMSTSYEIVKVIGETNE